MTKGQHSSTYNGQHIPLLRSIAVTLLLLFAGVLFMPVLGGYWLADDFDWVQDFVQYDWHDIPALFRGDWSRAASQEYRPLWALSFLLDLKLWKANPFALHLTNVIWHIVASALIWYLAAHILRAGDLAALLAVAIFIVAPIHVEPVAWISARGHILAPIFMISAILFFTMFKRQGRKICYIASLISFLAALATQEVAVSFPPLLLSFDVADEPRKSWQWLFRMLLRNIPFWILLAAYLEFRIFIFGRLSRASNSSSIMDILKTTYFTFQTLWLSFVPFNGAPGWLFATKLMLIFYTLGILTTPVLLLRGHQRHKYTQTFLYFAIIWPTISTAVLMGANSERHYYLASVGPAVILGVALACLFRSKNIPILLPGTFLIILLAINMIALSNGVGEMALNGVRSWQLRHQVDLAVEQATHVPNSIVVIIPEAPDNQRVLWDYFYPVALEPPFTSSIPSIEIIPSFTSCHCRAEEWTESYQSALQSIMHGKTGPIYVVEWNHQQSAFVTEIVTQAEFLGNEYLRPNGALVRSRNPGRPAPVLR